MEIERSTKVIPLRPDSTISFATPASVSHPSVRTPPAGLRNSSKAAKQAAFHSDSPRVSAHAHRSFESSGGYPRDSREACFGKVPSYGPIVTLFCGTLIVTFNWNFILQNALSPSGGKLERESGDQLRQSVKKSPYEGVRRPAKSAREVGRGFGRKGKNLSRTKLSPLATVRETSPFTSLFPSSPWRVGKFSSTPAGYRVFASAAVSGEAGAPAKWVEGFGRKGKNLSRTKLSSLAMVREGKPGSRGRRADGIHERKRDLIGEVVGYAQTGRGH